MSKKTINDLLDNDGIVIPIIQRDYVQGSDLEAERRNEFLDSLFRTLLIEDEKQNLDFVYGRTQKGLGFLPLDGQQRLTTLYLLSWFIYQVNGTFSSKKSQLQKFYYKTRNSSERFCNLISTLPDNYKFDFEDKKISSQITNLSSFDMSWNDDPTVKSMLQMLDAICEKYKKLKNKEYLSKLLEEKYDEQETFENLVKRMNERISSDAICFDLLDMNNDGFKLTDELYTKMNARGKQLTDFENFKARFIDYIDIEHPALKDEFCKKIEFEWTQLFWPYAYSRWENEINEKENEEDKESCKYPITDDFFMNFFKVITQLLYFRDNNDKKAADFVFDFEQIKSIYSTAYENDKDWNLKFLFSGLDFFYNLSNENKLSKSDRLEKFFDKYFTEIDSSQEKINLFIENKNLFEQAIFNGSGMNEKAKMYLYCILYFNQNNKNGDWEKYLRFIRNMLESKKQKDYSKNLTHLTSLIRLTDFGKYCSLFESAAKETDLDDALLNSKITATSEKEAFAMEISKARLIKTESQKRAIYSLENNVYLKGDLSNFIITKYFNQIESFSKSFHEIWNLDNQVLIAQSLIASGFKGLKNKKCKLGETIFFGTKASWDRILTEIDVIQTEWLTNFLNQYILTAGNTVEEKLNSIKKEALSKFSRDSFEYYLIKYSDFLTGLHYFAKKNNFEVRILNSESTKPLSAYHINPYVLTVCNKINNEKIVETKNCYSIQSDISALNLNNNVMMYCILDGWLIVDSNGNIPQMLKSKFNIGIDNLLKHNNEKDRVEIAVDFCNELFRMNSKSFE